ncbi:CLUMA_CG011837, isoform A [Clunio marinus]|uniref:CLUMA_CG011837, isoform A n=1 Tax=Clunio marinus TaxID=568069 RepID=A0A1J1IE43_9DIPT|nr:CLUMA_CG011837, isoform A [Clunio marinus]
MIFFGVKGGKLQPINWLQNILHTIRLFSNHKHQLFSVCLTFHKQRNVQVLWEYEKHANKAISLWHHNKQIRNIYRKDSEHKELIGNQVER